MAELQTAGDGKLPGARRSKKLSTRVDLTPMVDLGFLLITFFVFTATLSQARTMKLIMPDEHPTNDRVTAPESKTLSVLPGPDNQIYYYPGLALDSMAVTDYSAGGLRRIIQQKKNAIIAAGGKGEDMILLVKPTDEASFSNLVAVLDEVLINDVRKYVLMQPDKAELARLLKK